MPDRALHGGGRVGVAGSRHVHVEEQAEGPHQGTVIAHRLEIGDLPFHELNQALVPTDTLLQSVGVSRVPQLEQGERRCPGDPVLVRGERPIHRLGQQRLGSLELAGVDRRLAGVEEEQRTAGVFLVEQRGGSLQQVRRRRHVAAGQGATAGRAQVAATPRRRGAARGRRPGRARPGRETTARGGSQGTLRTRRAGTRNVSASQAAKRSCSRARVRLSRRAYAVSRTRMWLKWKSSAAAGCARRMSCFLHSAASGCSRSVRRAAVLHQHRYRAAGELQADHRGRLHDPAFDRP